jgi:hypothetical protein
MWGYGGKINSLEKEKPLVNKRFLIELILKL